MQFGMQVTTFVYRPLMRACINLELVSSCLPSLLATAVLLNGKLNWAVTCASKMEEVENLWKRMRVECVAPDSATWAIRFTALAAHGNLKGRTHELLTEAAGDGLQLDMQLLRLVLYQVQCCWL